MMMIMMMIIGMIGSRGRAALGIASIIQDPYPGSNQHFLP